MDLQHQRFHGPRIVELYIKKRYVTKEYTFTVTMHYIFEVVMSRNVRSNLHPKTNKISTIFFF